MGLERFWRCDHCGSETGAPQPVGWRLQGEETFLADRAARRYDLFFCRTECGAAWFASAMGEGS